MTLEVDLDTGPVHLERRVEIGEKSLASLLDELSRLGAEALIEVLASPQLLAHPVAQVGDVTYAHKLSKDEFHLVPAMSVDQLLRTIRLGQAFTIVNGRRLLVESATRCDGEGIAAGTLAMHDGRVVLGAYDGEIALERVRPESAKSMDAVAWRTGARLDHDQALWT
jgi:methionyl-tRNA formyltransferase